MKSHEVAVKPNLTITLHPDTQALDEVMVVAYGTAKKSSFTGSASTLKSDKIASRQTSNVTNALAGQVAGVQAISANGQPGEAAKIRIRGIGSMSASNAPLYVVDGIPCDEDKISSINSQDIESMTVLKDAASNALYGARGANGVVLITTKKGQNGKAVVNVDAKWGTNRRAVPNYDVMKNPAAYYETVYAAFMNGAAGGDPELANAMFLDPDEGGVGYQVYTTPEGENLIGTNGKLNPNAKLGYSDGAYFYTPDNWYNELFDKGNLRQEYNINISGATEKMNFYMSAGYLDDSGIIPNSGFSRFSTRLKADYQVNKWLKVGGNLSYVKRDSKYPDNQTDEDRTSSGNLFYVANMMAPVYPLYVRDAAGNIMIDSNGFTVYDYGVNTNFSRPFMNQSNPASALELDKREYVADIFSGKWFAEVSIWKGLKATANIGTDAYNTRSSNYLNPYYGQYETSGGVISVQHDRTFIINQQYLLTYNGSFGKHSIDVLTGHESYGYKFQNLYGSKQNLFNPNIHEINNAINTPSTNSYTNTYTTEGWLGRIQYDFADKYFGSVSYRRDASSRFSKDNRWGNFWSVGAGWLLNKENFMESATWIDMLKYKISYGVQGNDNLLYQDGKFTNYYPNQDQYKVANNNGDFALTMYYKGNPDITWETSHTLNTGFDFAFFSNRLMGSVEYFNRKTSDLLYYMPVAPTNGYSYVPKNVGSVRNQGLEIDLTGTLINTKNIDWSINANLTQVKNKILKLESSLGGELIDGTRIYREGESMYQMYLRKYVGVDPENGNALWLKDIVDDNGNITGQENTDSWSDATRYGTGDILPKIYGGFGTNLSLYGFDLSLSFAYQVGGRIYDQTYAWLMHSGDASSMGTNWHNDILKAWTPGNTTTDIPKVNTNDTNASSSSDRFLTSSNYLSFQNITLGYTIPKSWLRKMSIGSLRAYMVIDNVALFSARKGLDPRQSYTTSGSYTYSPIRSISGGISLSF